MNLQYDSQGEPFTMWGGNVIKIERMQITEDFYKEKAKKELRETQENVNEGLEELRKLLKDASNLVVPVDSNDFLMKFLRPTKFYSKSAFKKIQAFYKYKQSHAIYSQDIMPSSVKKAFEHSSLTVLSPRDQHGRRVMVVESGGKGVGHLSAKYNWDPRKTSLTDLFRGLQLGIEAVMAEPRTQVCGIVVIMDMKGMSFSHVKQFSPFFAKAVVDWIQDCLPVRLKGIHVVNQPYIFNILYTLFKPLVSEKLRSRLYLHGQNMKTLLQLVDGKCLMKRFGGSLPDDGLSGDVIWKILNHYEEYFQANNSYGYIAHNKK